MCVRDWLLLFIQHISTTSKRRTVFFSTVLRICRLCFQTRVSLFPTVLGKSAIFTNWIGILPKIRKKWLISDRANNYSSTRNKYFPVCFQLIRRGVGGNISAHSFILSKCEHFSLLAISVRKQNIEKGGKISHDSYFGEGIGT